MLERIVENWLTRINERNFILPFSQLLISQGYKLFYVSHHTMMEAGKDIIAKKNGKYFCYQVKEGNVTLSKYTGIFGELNELLMHPIIHPSIPAATPFKSFLVATGDIGDPVRTRIVERNLARWGQSKKTNLEYIDKGQLLPDFINFYGKYFPSEPKNFKLLLELYLSNGASQFPKKMFTTFLEEYFDIYSSDKVSPKQIGSLVAASVIMTSYILTPWFEKRNYIAQIEALVCLNSYILAIANKNDLDEKHWKMSFDLITSEIDQLFLALIEELKKREHLVEGDWFSDMLIYPARVSILIGYLSAFALSKKVRGIALSEENQVFIQSFCLKYSTKMKFFGEVYTPLFINFGLLLDGINHPTGLTILRVILAAFLDKKRIPQPYGWPSPYYDYEDSLEIRNGLLNSQEHFFDQSYFIKPIMELFIRRNKKEMVTDLWRKISHIQTVSFVVDAPWQVFLWRAKKGKEESLFPRQTESWSRLLVNSKDTNFNLLPKELLNNPGFTIFFITVFPHRVNDQIYRFIDITLNPEIFKN